MDQPHSPQPPEPFPLADPSEFPIARPIDLPVDAGGLQEPPPFPIVPRRPRVWTVFTVLVLTIVVNLAANSIFLLGASELRGYRDLRDYVGDLPKHRADMLAVLAVSMCVILLGGWLAALASPVPWRARLRLGRSRMTFGQIVATALGTMAISWIYSMLEMLDLIPASETLQQLDEAMSAMTGASLAGAVVVIGIMPGICEEVLFRGYVQTRLTQRWGAPISIVFAALAFGAFHMDLWQGVYAVFVGIFLGLAAERAGSIVPAMIGHATNNTFYVLLGSWMSDTEAPSSTWVVLLLALGVAVFLACLYLVRWTPELVPDAEPSPAVPDDPESEPCEPPQS